MPMYAYRQERGLAEDLAVRALDHIPFGIVIVSEEMKVILHNETAASLFATADGIGLSQGHLLLNRWGTDEFKSRISTSLNRVAEGGLPCTVVLRVERPSGRMAYQVIAHPLCHQSDDNPPQHHGVWIISIHDPDQRTELPHALLRDYYRMTDGEIEVCRQLFISGSIDDVAVELGISRNTVKTHLQRIYAKCGVKSQSLLVMRLTLGVTR
jgi:DNA-binding CsgD family transcriptional regulator